MKTRKPNRKSDYDYAQNGCYFVTTVTKDRENCFGKIENNKLVLNECGEIVKNQWEWLHEQYKYLELDEFIVMPNHFHAILNIDSDLIFKPVGTGRDLSLLYYQNKSYNSKNQPK